MQEFTTGWFDTLQTNLRACCNARVTRNFREVRIDWTVFMRLATAGASIASNIYIDTMVSGNPTSIGDGQERIKDTSGSWNGTIEHSISGVLTFENVNAGSGVLTFSSTGNFASPSVFSGETLNINWEEYDANAAQDTVMPFHSVFTTEEYLENHKGLNPRNNLYNNSGEYVFRHNEYKNAYRKF